jgi:UDPglucose 6-dehydrogenase
VIGVVGLGFVGLTTALAFSSKGFAVWGFDSDSDRAGAIGGGEVPFHEPGLKEALHDYLGKNFFVADSMRSIVEESRIIFFCVGTPCDEGGAADLSHLLIAIGDALDEISEKRYRILVVKSTVPPGTTASRIKPFIEARGLCVGKDVGLACNPEFLREGYAWEDVIKADRIVIGQDDEASGRAVEEIYVPFGSPIFRVSLNTAEFIKYLSNTLLATLISFSNEMSMIARGLGNIDTIEAFRILHLDRRWSGNPAPMTGYVYPGCGFGGYCLPKDTQALCAAASSSGIGAPILQSVLAVNARIRRFVVESVCGGAPDSGTIGILGLSFKAGSDDVRESPAADIIRLLLERGRSIVAYDPLAMKNFEAEYGLPIQYAASLEDLVERAQILVLLTAWPEFKARAHIFRGKSIFDFRYYLGNEAS